MGDKVLERGSSLARFPPKAGEENASDEEASCSVFFLLAVKSGTRPPKFRRA